MPKDAKKNIDRYKIRGGELNDFEFNQNQASLKESLPGNRKAAKSVKRAAAKKSAGNAKKSAGKKMAKKTSN
jgi:hypothetical protein